MGTTYGPDPVKVGCIQLQTSSEKNQCKQLYKSWTSMLSLDVYGITDIDYEMSFCCCCFTLKAINWRNTVLLVGNDRWGHTRVTSHPIFLNKEIFF